MPLPLQSISTPHADNAQAAREPVSPLTQSLLERASSWRSNPQLGYGFAIVVFALALAARFAVNSWLPAGFPFLTFFPAIILSSFIGGRGPGILCAVASVLAAWFWFVPPFGSFTLNFQSSVAVAFFAFIAAVDVFIIDLMTRALERLKLAQAETQSLLQQRTTLFHELQHRVANNMTVVSTVLATQQKRLAHNPEAADAIKAARARFDSLSRIHRQLHNPDNSNLAISEHITQLANDLVASLGAGRIACKVEAQPLVLDGERSITLSLLMVEVITNSIKHAFDATESGTITILLRKLAGNQAELIVRDDGKGIAADFDASQSDRLGMRIMQNLAKTLDGQLSFQPSAQGKGTDVKLVFALQ